MKNKTNLWILLKEFIRFGCFTFGGGLSIIAQMQQLYVDRKKDITTEELLDLTSVARSLPGAMIGNTAMLYGYRVGGILGGLTALFGMTVPSLLIMIGVSFCYRAFRDNYWVVAAMSGAQAAVVPIIISATLSMVKGSIKNAPCLAVVLLSAVLYFFFNVNTITLILFGIVAGLLMSEYYERKEAGKHDPS